MADHKTRRVKILSVDAEDVVAMFRMRHCQVVALPVNVEIPEGCEVLQMQTNWPNRCVDFLITHESFPEVPLGEVPPSATPAGLKFAEFHQVPFPFITSDELRDFFRNDGTSRVNRAICDEAAKLVEAMVKPLDGCERPEFVALRQKLLCGLAEQKAEPPRVQWANPSEVDVAGQVREMTDRLIGDKCDRTV